MHTREEMSMQEEDRRRRSSGEARRHSGEVPRHSRSRERRGDEEVCVPFLFGRFRFVSSCSILPLVCLSRFVFPFFRCQSCSFPFVSYFCFFSLFSLRAKGGFGRGRRMGIKSWYGDAKEACLGLGADWMERCSFVLGSDRRAKVGSGLDG